MSLYGSSKKTCQYDQLDSRIKWIDHSCILSDEYLPTFNSHSIESALHKIPGLSEKESRNSGTKHTLYPGQSKVYYLPEETMVVATDGPYWDNPNPQKPNEREVLYVEKDIISKVDIDTLLFAN